MFGMVISERIERFINFLMILGIKINGIILYVYDFLGFIKCFFICIFIKFCSFICRRGYLG